MNSSIHNIVLLPAEQFKTEINFPTAAKPSSYVSIYLDGFFRRPAPILDAETLFKPFSILFFELGINALHESRWKDSVPMLCGYPRCNYGDYDRNASLCQFCKDD